MLFILTMEPLHRLFERATRRGVLEPLACTDMKQRLSIFADDVVVFIKPNPVELEVCKSILDLFGGASGLWINMMKSAALPIRCNDEEINMACEELGCQKGAYPIKYLGLPLTLRKQSTV